jgi:phage baseplate assembly protein W
MIPKINSASGFRIERQTSRTYRIDFENKRIVGIVDGLDAEVQAVRKIVDTERYSERIYSGDYGIELQRLIGASMPFVEASMDQTLKDAFMADERVSSVRDIKIDRISVDELNVVFTIQTINGDSNINHNLGV